MLVYFTIFIPIAAIFLFHQATHASTWALFPTRKLSALFTHKKSSGDGYLAIASLVAPIMLWIALFSERGFSASAEVEWFDISLFASWLVLLLIAFHDVYKRLISDRLLILSFLLSIPYFYHIDSTQLIQSHLAGALLAGGLFASIHFVGKLASNQSLMGWGDVKLFAYLGLWMGIELTPQAMILSSVLALGYVLITKNKQVPYAPALIVSTLLAMCGIINY